MFFKSGMLLAIFLSRKKEHDAEKMLDRFSPKEHISISIFINCLLLDTLQNDSVVDGISEKKSHKTFQKDLMCLWVIRNENMYFSDVFGKFVQGYSLRGVINRK